MTTAGDLLLYALSDHDSLPWAQFGSAVAELSGDFERGGLALRRFRTAELLSALGHCDRVVRDGKEIVAAAPAILVRLPVTGLPVAVLAGRRQSRTEDELAAACGAVPNSQIEVEQFDEAEALLPTRLSVVADAEQHLQTVAANLGIPYASQPPAWALAALSKDFTAINETLQWERRSPLNWVKRQFDPMTLSMTNSDGVKPAAYELWSYEDPYSRRQKFFLRIDGSEAEVGREWGRWIVLHSEQKSVLYYDGRRNLLAVPSGVPLPPLLARALTLCSGRASASQKLGERFHHLYGSVPRSVATEVAQRLGQQLRDRDIQLGKRL